MSTAPVLLVFDPQASLSLAGVVPGARVHAFPALTDAQAGFAHLEPDVVIARLDAEGQALCRWVAERDPLLPVLLLATEPLAAAAVVDGLRDGARDVVPMRGEWRAVLEARVDAARSWRSAVQHDAEAQLQSFLIQTELYQEQVKALNAQLTERASQLEAARALLDEARRELRGERERARRADDQRAVYALRDALRGPLEALEATLAGHAASAAVSGPLQACRAELSATTAFEALDGGGQPPVYRTLGPGALLAACARALEASGLQAPSLGATPDAVLATDQARVCDAVVLLAAWLWGAGAVRIREVTLELHEDDVHLVLGLGRAAPAGLTTAGDAAEGAGPRPLVAVRALLTSLGGFVDVADPTAPRLVLPRAVEEATVERAAQPAPQGGVLLVDDDPAVREVLEGMLSQAGYAVRVAGDAERALRRLAEALPSLVLLDVGLPGADGYSLLAQLKVHPEWSAIPVIMLSGATQRERSLGAGAADFLDKPVLREDLLAAVSRHIGRPRRVVYVLGDDGTAEPATRALSQSGFVGRAVAAGDVAASRDVPAAFLLPATLRLADALDALEALGEVRDVPVVVWGDLTDDAERAFLATQFSAVVASDEDLSAALEALLDAR